MKVLKREAKVTLKVLAALDRPCQNEAHDGFKLRRRFCNDCVFDLTYRAQALVGEPK